MFAGSLVVPAAATTSGDGTGPGVRAAGMGSRAALAQETCDRESGRTNFQFVGAGPYCVRPWDGSARNGARTASGVTATDVKVVIYAPNDQMVAAQQATGASSPVTDRSTGAPGSYEAMISDYDEVYQHAIREFGTYQTWGRNPVFEVVVASGTDEASQRADAVRVIAEKPFMVMDVSNLNIGAPVFAQVVANERIIVQGVIDEDAYEQAPYRYGTQSAKAFPYLAASFLGRSLSGEKARWAGTDLRENERRFGLVYPARGFDVATLQRLLRTSGSSPLAAEVSYEPGDADAVQQTAATLVSRLKSAGVTSVLLVVEPTAVTTLMSAAAEQQYEPEWIYTGYRFQEFDLFGRGNDASQMAHAFGLALLGPAFVDDGSAPLDVFSWYWGPDRGVFGTAGLAILNFVYQAMHYAGPDLTANNVARGLFAVPAIGGAKTGTVTFQVGYGRTTGLPYDEYANLGTDRALIWWNPDVYGGTQAVATIQGQGKFMYVDGGKRYAYGQFPKREPRFFDPGASVAEAPRAAAFPDGAQPTPNPCGACPSTAAGTTTS